MAETVDLTALSDEDLMEQWTDLGDKVQADKERLLAFSKEHQRRNRERQLRDAVGGLTEDDLAMLQGMTPDGIESQAEVGEG